MLHRRMMLGLAVIASLAIGSLAGVIVVRESPATFSTAKNHTVNLAPKDSSVSSPLTPAKVISAMHALGAKQTAIDKFPVPSFLTTTDVLPTSVHLILTTDDGSELWIGRTTSALCLIYASSTPSPSDGIDAGSTCQTASQFASSGLTLREGADLWTWNGATFTTTIAPPVFH
jgi:hypothetical protein